MPVVRRAKGSIPACPFALTHVAVSSCLPILCKRPVQWSENYSPTVRVETVQIVSRDTNGGDERVETPAEDRLTVEIPRAGATDPTLLECTGAAKPEGFTFSLADCAARSDEPGQLDALTPTYLVANLRLAPPVKKPVTWRATLADLGPGRQAALFDPARLARALETLLQAMWERRCGGLPPAPLGC